MEPLRQIAFVVFAALLGVLSRPATSHAYSLTSYSYNEPITLKLVDGRNIEGRYRGTLGRTSDPNTYGERYEKWRTKHASSAPPALGETLLVTYGSGERVRGALRGFADKALLIAADDSTFCVVLPLKDVSEVRRAGETTSSVADRRRWKSAPSLYAVSLQVQGQEVAVPVSVIADRSMLPRAGAHTGTTVVVGVVVAVVLLSGAALAAMASSFSQPMI